MKGKWRRCIATVPALTPTRILDAHIDSLRLPLWYSDQMPEPLSLDEVRHVARLARLRLTDAQLEQYRRELSSVLDYIAKLSELDVEGVEPMAHPTDITNRLDEDVVAPALTLAQVLANAPAVEGEFLAVPKVLDDEGGS